MPLLILFQKLTKKIAEIKNKTDNLSILFLFVTQK